jgi:hypothetical protein
MRSPSCLSVCLCIHPNSFVFYAIRVVPKQSSDQFFPELPVCTARNISVTCTPLVLGHVSYAAIHIIGASVCLNYVNFYAADSSSVVRINLC